MTVIPVIAPVSAAIVAEAAAPEPSPVIVTVTSPTVYPCPLFERFILSTVPLTAVFSTADCNAGNASASPRTKVAAAPLPPPPEKVMSAKVYPDPAVFIVTLVTASPVNTAVAEPPMPSPLMRTSGTLV